MSPRYEFDPTKVSVSFATLDKDTYEMQVGEPKAFVRTNAEGNESIGIRFPLTVKGGNFDGKRPQPHTAYLTNEGSESFTKAFLMAVLGFSRSTEGEEAFNDEMRGSDWSYDPKTGAVGDAWRKATGKRVLIDVDVEPALDKNKQPTGEMRNKYTGFNPLNSQNKEETTTAQ